MSVITSCVIYFTIASSNRSLKSINLNENGVAVTFVGTNSVISPEIVCTSNLYILYFAQEDKEDYDNCIVILVYMF